MFDCVVLFYLILCSAALGLIYYGYVDSLFHGHQYSIHYVHANEQESTDRDVQIDHQTEINK